MHEQTLDVLALNWQPMWKSNPLHRFERPAAEPFSVMGRNMAIPRGIEPLFSGRQPDIIATISRNQKNMVAESENRTQVIGV